MKDLTSFQPEVVAALAMPLGDYTLYSPPPPAGGAILSLILNVLKGESPASRSGSCPAGNQNPTPSRGLGQPWPGQLWPFPVPSSAPSSDARAVGNGSRRCVLPWLVWLSACAPSPPPTGFNFSAESVAGPEGNVTLYHHLVETFKFAGGLRWRLWDPRSHPEVQVRWPRPGRSVRAGAPAVDPESLAGRLAGWLVLGQV